MKFLEKDLEEIIFNANPESLEGKGLEFNYHKVFRQKRIGNYGRADLIGVAKPYLACWSNGKMFIDEGRIDIYELKKDKISLSTFAQSLQYYRGIQRYLEERGKDHLFKINIILIGREIDKNSCACYLSSIFDNVFIYTYNYDVDGIKFKHEYGYKLTDEGFKHPF